MSLMGPARPLLVTALLALAFLSGCGAERDATSKELSALTAEIAKLRAEQASMSDRLQALEHARPQATTVSLASAPPAGPAEPPPPVAMRSLESDRPALDVVKLGPAADEGDGDTDEDGPRTVLRSGANGIVVEEASGASTDAKKPSSKKTDKVDRKKTAASPKP